MTLDANALIALIDPLHARIVKADILLSDEIDRKMLLSSGQIADSYLVLLAHSHGSALATFDAGPP